MKKIKDLIVTDFPNIDETKFIEWQKAQKERANLGYVIFPIMALLILQMYFVKGFLSVGIFFIGMIILMIFISPTTMKIKKLQKELGINNKDIRDALKKK